MKEVFLSVVIPCYEEMANLQKGVLDKIDHFLKKKSYTFEIIIVDDGSKDGSIQFLEQFVKEHKEFCVIKNTHQGKAGSVTKGVLAAKGEFVLFTDMDQATPIEELDKIMPFAKEDYDIVIGSRKATRQGAPWTRVLMARGMILTRKLLVGLPQISDTQCGFKLFRKQVAKELFQVMKTLHHGFDNISGSNVTAGFDVELLVIAQKKGYSVKEVPVRWLYVETRRVSPVKDSLEGIVSLLRIAVNKMRHRYS